ncbi:MAG: PilZ domain-containing protein [Vulcanimicrobiota bacterium]
MDALTNKRQTTRKRIVVSVKGLALASSSVASLDLSRNGLRLAPAEGLRRGQYVELVLKSERFEVFVGGVVRWLADGHAGIEFVGLSRQSALKLKAALEASPT